MIKRWGQLRLVSRDLALQCTTKLIDSTKALFRHDSQVYDQLGGAAN